MTPEGRFKINAYERDSPLWRAIEKHYREKLELLRSRNDSDKSPEETAKLRGRIAECKDLLSLADELPKLDA